MEPSALELTINAPRLIANVSQTHAMSNATMTRLATEPIAAVLKSNGYRKTGNTFRRALDDVDHLMNVQKSASSSSGELRATVNIGIWIRSLAPIRAGVPDKASLWSAHWRCRLGTLMPAATDRWWSATSDDEASAIGQEIAEALVRYGLPMLEKLADASALAALWRQGVAPGLTEVQRRRLLEMYEHQDQAG